MEAKPERISNTVSTYRCTSMRSDARVGEAAYGCVRHTNNTNVGSGLCCVRCTAGGFHIACFGEGMKIIVSLSATFL